VTWPETRRDAQSEEAEAEENIPGAAERCGKIHAWQSNGMNSSSSFLELSGAEYGKKISKMIIQG
jgi:hypothetical protein